MIVSLLLILSCTCREGDKKANVTEWFKIKTIIMFLITRKIEDSQDIKPKLNTNTFT